MHRHFPSALSWMLGLFLILGTAQAMAATQPTLFTVGSGTPAVLAQGAQKSWPITISEDKAFDAVFQGGMWLPNPAGGRIYAKYQRHILHANGNWTWIGTVSTTHGDQAVVLTFGKDGVFGLVPQASGYPLRIVTRDGQTRIVATLAGNMARSTMALRLHSNTDYLIPPRVLPKGLSAKLLGPRAATPPVKAAATATGPAVIDVMVAYTPGFVSETGSQSAALTRIQNLVDMTNQAYTASGVNQQIRLVNTVQVDYPDNTSNQSALDDITGIDENGNTVPIPASLQNIAMLRNQSGADLVTMIRSFDNSTQGGCGVGWLIGGDQAPIVPSSSSVYGYSVVSDGTSSGYYCLDTTFAHELGHNMGDAHDRGSATESGAYSYSYGYVGNGTNGFSTIMAYGTATDTPLAIFSNPNISSCQNTPCGVADSSASSADNVHSMNNTAPLIAQFRPTMVGNLPTGPYVHNDINRDGKSDILFTNPSTGQLLYWIMNGSRYVTYAGFAVGTQYRPIGTGDFNGDGNADIVWTDGTSVWVWLSNGSGGFTGPKVGSLPSGAGWTLIGCIDIDGDGKQDMVWYNSNTQTLQYWLMNGSAVVGTHSTKILPGLRAVGLGDFNGDGLGDVAFVSGTNVQKLYVWIGNGTNFTQYQSNVTIGPSWQFAGVGDINGDGMGDVLWFQPQTGTVWYWLMNGATVIANKQITAGPAYSVAGIGDFDGDGYADVLWKSTDNVIWMWLHTSPYNYAGYKVLPAPVGWTILP